MRDTAKKDKEEVMTEENGEGVDENETNKRLIILLQKMMLMMTTEMHVIAASSGDRKHGVDLILFTWSNFDFVLVLKEWNTIFGSIMDMARTPQVLNRRRMGTYHCVLNNISMPKRYAFSLRLLSVFEQMCKDMRDMQDF